MDSPKFGRGMRDAGFFLLFVGILENRQDPNKRSSGQGKANQPGRLVVSPFKKTTECLVNSYQACRTGGLAGQRAKRDTPTWSATTSGRVETKVVALRTRVSRFAFSPVNSPVSQANSHLIETARNYFVLTSYQKSAGGVITYQLLPRCSIDICYLPGGRSVWEKNCAEGLGPYSRPRAQFFPQRTDLAR